MGHNVITIRLEEYKHDLKFYLKWFGILCRDKFCQLYDYAVNILILSLLRMQILLCVYIFLKNEKRFDLWLTWNDYVKRYSTLQMLSDACEKNIIL